MVKLVSMKIIKSRKGPSAAKVCAHVNHRTNQWTVTTQWIWLKWKVMDHIKRLLNSKHGKQKMVSDFSCGSGLYLCLVSAPVEQAGTGPTVSSHTTDSISKTSSCLMALFQWHSLCNSCVTRGYCPKRNLDRDQLQRQYVNNCLMCLSAANISKTNTELWMLQFVEFLTVHLLFMKLLGKFQILTWSLKD